MVGELGGEPGGGLIVISGTFTIAHRPGMIEVTAQHRLPAFYPFRVFVEDGGLFFMVLKPSNFTGARHRTWTASCGVQARPSFQSSTPTKFELVINLKTAKALGLESAADACSPAPTR